MRNFILRIEYGFLVAIEKLLCMIVGIVFAPMFFVLIIEGRRRLHGL